MRKKATELQVGDKTDGKKVVAIDKDACDYSRYGTRFPRVRIWFYLDASNPNKDEMRLVTPSTEFLIDDEETDEG